MSYGVWRGFFVFPGARRSTCTMTHLCDLEEGYGGDGLQTWFAPKTSRFAPSGD